MFFLMTAVSKNVEAKFSGRISMFQKLFQLDTMELVSKSCRNCCHINIPGYYKLETFYSHVARGAYVGSVAHRSPVDVVATWKIIRYRPFWMNWSHHIKRIIFSYSGMNLVPMRIINDDSDAECEIAVDLDNEANLSDVVAFSGECSTKADVTLGWKPGMKLRKMHASFWTILIFCLNSFRASLTLMYSFMMFIRL